MIATDRLVRSVIQDVIVTNVLRLELEVIRFGLLSNLRLILGVVIGLVVSLDMLAIVYVINDMTNTEINEAVGRKLGWSWESDGCVYHRNGFLETLKDLPDYCDSIAAAWEIVQLSKIGSQCVKRIDDTWEWMLFKDGKMFSAQADTAPMAICLAFLKL